MKKKLILFFILFSNLFSNENKIVLLGDTQRTLWFEFFREQNEEIRQFIFPKITSENPDALILLGDLTNWGASEKEWNYFDSIFDTIHKLKIPSYPVLGNHDYFGSNEKAIANINKRFPFFKENTWYSKQIGSIFFISLNSNLEELDKKERHKQIQFLDSELSKASANNTIKLIICAWHHPIYTNSLIVDDNIEVREEFMPIISKYPKVKLIASGHCHSYEHFFKNNIHFLVSGGGGGPRQELRNKGKERHLDLYKNDKIRQFHYSLLLINDDKVEMKIIGFDKKNKIWGVIDKWTID